MKKLFLFLFVLFLSCSITNKTSQIYQRYYPYVNPQSAIDDIFDQLPVYGVDSIPLEEWLTLKAKTEEGYLIQKTISKTEPKMYYVFIYNTFVSPDSTFYEFKIYRTITIKELKRKN
jgi:hypothetical protein